MLSSSHIVGLCIAAAALSSGVRAEKAVAETFGHLHGLHGLHGVHGVGVGVGVPGVLGVGVGHGLYGPGVYGPGVGVGVGVPGVASVGVGVGCPASDTTVPTRLPTRTLLKSLRSGVRIGRDGALWRQDPPLSCDLHDEVSKDKLRIGYR
ncbi:hypothetical protein PF007_g25296 [Phytophthora fragariae]|uniref:RxLR effector protein n=1 Tax=Phytophthora fragariae TaxID=53985 RepID=A0A6A3QEY6_9STRA|nr:hypothetical protein PF003_g12027 [Phytophthora fragariae]KAE8926050.1 hypothetical protein PF009_g23749 [Phytophthora fragariae]KAE9074729.1 hypothetical protein PF007_g25296 [Phytophthora fragariae]KAE9093072.1 hypothetical protein PF006_g24533 [Phytophthora fragariae]KAE9265071.1 hypothetical protein PF001_g31040 [Phytophthora fragariae]